MKRQPDPGISSEHAWQWPIDRTRYDHRSDLSADQIAAIHTLLERPVRGPSAAERREAAKRTLHGLLHPLEAVRAIIGVPHRYYSGGVIRVLLHDMAQRQTTFWGWSRAEWCATNRASPARNMMLATSYLLGQFTDFRDVTPICRQYLVASMVFGQAAVDAAVNRMRDGLRAMGHGRRERVHPTVSELLLRSYSPYLEQITLETLRALWSGTPPCETKAFLVPISRVLCKMQIIAQPLSPESATPTRLGSASTLADVPPAWTRWAQRWYHTSPLAPQTRAHTYYDVLKAGRWLAHTHPDIVTPQQWTRELAAEYVAAVCHMVVGQYTHAPSTVRSAQRVGKPLAASTKDANLGAMRTFFKDCQAWEWIAARFDPGRAFATPPAIHQLIGPNPRIIADDVWAKLLWAGLNLAPDDLPKHHMMNTPWYPWELARALIITWLFAGLRSDDLIRLRVGCVRWNSLADRDPQQRDAGPHAPICWLDVPVTKTSTAYTKAVDRLVGEAIGAWEAVRPDQCALLDRKTGELVDFLFAYRGRQVSKSYLNRALIPVVCTKAGVPLRDPRGLITSHRARSTIASQLASGKAAMSLFELKEWLGHRNLDSTLHYVTCTPTKLAKSYADADYFKRNIRMIEVLIDQAAITTGAAAHGEPWKFYDLGHGYCTYDFFEQCPHRMACARCAFYRPKESTQAQILEGKAHLQRMLQEIPLTDEERIAVEDGISTLEKLSGHLVDVPTPAGPTPRQLAAWSQDQIPLIQRDAEQRGN